MSYKDYAIVDLHLHLDGSLSPEAIIKVAKKENIKLPSYEPSELKKYLEVEENCPSLNEYLTKFNIPGLVLQTPYGLKECALDLLKREARDGLKYVEIRMAPQLSINKGLSQEDVVQILIEALKEGERLYGIKSNLILCLMRGDKNNKENLETIKVASKYLSRGVVAIDLAGAEALFSNERYADLFLLAQNLEIPFTIHCGEASGASSIISALSFSPKRVGHGVHAIEDENVMNYLKANAIPLELCPKSNLDTKAVKSLKEFPIKTFIEKGIIVTLNTDDMTVSNTNLKNEYELIHKLGLSDQELKQIAINSINSAFISKREKQDLINYLESLE